MKTLLIAALAATAMATCAQAKAPVETAHSVPAPTPTAPSRPDFINARNWERFAPGVWATTATVTYDTRTHEVTKRAGVVATLNQHVEIEIVAIDASRLDPKIGAEIRYMAGKFKPKTLLFGVQLGYRNEALKSKFNGRLIVSYFHNGADITFNLNYAQGYRTPGYNQFHPGHRKGGASWELAYMARDQMPQSRHRSRLGAELVGDFDGNLWLGPTILQDFGDVRLMLGYYRAITHRSTQSDQLKAMARYGF